MLTYHLTKTLTSPKDEWDQLVLSELGENIHPKRIHGFCLSREALKLCFADRGIDLKVTDLKLKNFGAVKNQNSLTISLSHTPEFGAALIADKRKIISVGIDIEPVQRIVKPSILERISHPEDLKLEPLATWSLKEATFKAIMNTGKFLLPVEFSSIKINHHSWLHADSNLAGEWKLEQEQGLMVALAWIKI
ncbi:MAG: 4'-phosphopantetheinyl transferase superfamily protein [Bdellovibrionales bacterium]|nr:4'-phosphopantetheinyl transferase superfamily protein [Bdellovibrionales bacterium]